MSVTLNRSAFATALSAAARVAGIRSSIPVAQCVRMEAKDGLLELSATDFDHWLDLSIPCDGELEPVCVHAGRLSEVMAAALSEGVDMKMDSNRLEVRVGRGRRNFATVPAQDFPRPELETEIHFELNAETFKEAIQFTLPAAAPTDDVTKRGLAGIHLVTRDGQLKAVATDRFNLNVIDLAKVDAEIEATIGLKAAEIAASLLPAGDITVDMSSRAILIAWPGGRLRGPLLEDAFVPFERVFAESYTGTACVEGKTFLDALRAVRPLGEDDKHSRSKRIKLSLNGCGTLTANSSDGEAVEEFQVDWNGDELTLGVAVSRLDRMLRCFGDSVLTVKFNGPRDPFVFEAAAKPDRCGVLFPMSI